MNFKTFDVRRAQGTPTIPDLRRARPEGFRGRPVFREVPCAEECVACRDVCPTEAIALEPLKLDLARCVFCGLCEEACPPEKLSFTNDPRLAARSLGGLVVAAPTTEAPTVAADPDLARLFGRSLKLRQVSAGGCNGCELELNALANVNFDLQRYGIEWVASPRHADGLVLTGPLTANMRDAVRLAWNAMPDPRFVVAFGACTLSGGLYRRSGSLDRTVLGEAIPVLYVAGCPPHPLSFAHAILDLLDRA